MLFNSLPFLVFISAFLSVFFLLRGVGKLGFLLLSSYLFYAWWDWRLLGLLWLTTFLDYSLGLAIDDTHSPTIRNRLVTGSVAVNLLILGIFKYYNFFIDSLTELMAVIGCPMGHHSMRIVLPIGISFYTFMSMSYTIDVYRRRIRAERSLLRFATFVAFFPHLVAGPILRPEHFLPQLHREPRFQWDQAITGIGWMLMGYLKKVVMADSMSPYIDRIFESPRAHGGAAILIGLLFYAFQIYGDFSGYSDIAYGVARIMGFDIGRNFRSPYFSASFSEFWQRWHISLSGWLRDYLYIPLGGNRRGTMRTYANLMTTMLLGGLWHGANWTFVIWGFLHGFYLVIQRLMSGLGGPSSNSPVILRKWIQPFQVSLVFVLVLVAWTFFRSPNLTTALIILQRVCNPGTFLAGGIPFLYFVVKGFICIGFLVSGEFAATRFDLERTLVKSPTFRVVMFSSALCIIAFLGSFEGGQFIYFQF